MGIKIAIGADHRGFTLKQQLKTALESSGIQTEDVGTYTPDSVDYPEFGKKVALKVSRRECAKGILICGSGIGMSMVANKFPGIRAALCFDVASARMSREHNDANVLVMREGIDPEMAEALVTVWIETPFSGGRHQRRVAQIIEIEKENFKNTA